MTDPRPRYVHKSVVRALLVLGTLVTLAGKAGALDIHGRVLNGTSGKPVGGVEVGVVDPRHGLATQGDIHTDARGVFAAPGLNDKISMFLVQVNYEGVMYTEIVRPDKDTLDVEVKVYDTTTSWEDVRVTLPHFMARRSDDTLSIDRMFLVSNNTSPPKTVYGQGAGFRLYIPDEQLRTTSLFATSLGIPIAVAALPTGTPGLYVIEFPFKPGETQVGVSFDVAYPGTGYVYTESLSYTIDEATVMTEDPQMEITSTSVTLGEPQDARGFKTYRLTSLPKSSTLALGFRGGAARVQTESAGHEVVTLPERWQKGSIALIAGVTLLLVLMMAFASKSPLVGTDRPALLASRRNSILSQIARLDDLFEMGAVPDRPYREKRAELVETLSRIMYQIERAQPKTFATARKPKGASDAR